jgi:hypothetical protein
LHSGPLIFEKAALPHVVFLPVFNILVAVSLFSVRSATEYQNCNDNYIINPGAPSNDGNYSCQRMNLVISLQSLQTPPYQLSSRSD